MAKKKTPEENAKILIDKMFELAGHAVKYEDIVDRKDNWFWDWTMTMEQIDGLLLVLQEYLEIVLVILLMELNGLV